MTPSLLFCGACSATTFARQCRTSKFQSEPTALRHGAKAYSKQRGLYENQTVPNHRYRGDVFSSCTVISGTGYRIAGARFHYKRGSSGQCFQTSFGGAAQYRNCLSYVRKRFVVGKSVSVRLI